MSRELDAQIAEKVMGWKRVDKNYSGLCPKEQHDLGTGLPAHVKYPPYSTDIAQAWEVVEKIGRAWNGFPFMLQWTQDIWRNPCWEAGWYEWSHGEVESRATATAETPAMAICLAALQVANLQHPSRDAGSTEQ